MGYIHFNIECWQALSPGLVNLDDWISWAKEERQWPETFTSAPVNEIPVILRRRMSLLSKLAIQTAIPLAKNNEIDYIIFSSRHGELHRTVKLLTDILQGEDASPIAFSQSVHNTAAGLFTIAMKKPIPVTSLAAKDDSLHSALIEASAYLAENPQHRILVVDFDEPLPDPYKKFDTGEEYQAFALGMIVTSGKQYQLSWGPEGAREKAGTGYPQTLDVIAHLVGGCPSWTSAGLRTNWHWKC